MNVKRAIAIPLAAIALSLLIIGAVQILSSHKEEAHAANTTPAISDLSFTCDIIGDNIDISSSALSNGMLAIKTHDLDGTRHKVMVTKDGKSRAYDVSNGTYLFPLPFGDGEYSVKLFENLHDDEYKLMFQTDVESSNEENAYLTSNSLLVYSGDVIPEDTMSILESPSCGPNMICEYVESKLSYDFEKARKIANESFHGLNGNESLSLNSGVCSDYCAITCMMMRTNGVPCKISVGHCSASDSLHCWITYLQDGKWIVMDPTMRDTNIGYDESSQTYEELYSF